nr:cellulose synthase complex periplasmic endoglucanase BcsZ [Pseudomonas sp.]
MRIPSIGARARRLASALTCLLLPGLAAAQDQHCTADTWPLWQTFRTHFVQPDGRVLDASTPQQHSSSEGQSYAMFFALVGNDRASFDKLWRWARDNLAGGDIAANLPGWWWGLDDKGTWRLLDRNSASDADLWFAYALFEAARLWQDPHYAADARALLANVAKREVAELPGLGTMLLPGFDSFAKPDHYWQLNPSYLPIPVLRRLQQLDPQGPWQAIARNTGSLIKASNANGFVADWVGYRGTSPNSGMFVIDQGKGEIGSYDAIRTYLWAGLTPATDPQAKALLDSLQGMSRAVASQGTPPEKVDMRSGALHGTGPFGFSAALLPYFKALKQPYLLDQQQARVEQLMAASLTAEALKQRQPPYYDFVLSLFALGHLDRHYQFLADGKLQPSWESTCPPAATR